MTVNQVEELLRKYLAMGFAVVVVLIGPATAPGGSPKPQVITVTPGPTTTSAQAATPSSDSPSATSPTPTSAAAATSPTPDTGQATRADNATQPTEGSQAAQAGPDTAVEPTDGATAIQPTEGSPAAATGADTPTQPTGASPNSQSTDENRARSSGTASRTTAPKRTGTAAPNNTAAPNDTAGQTSSTETTTQASGTDPGQPGSAAPPAPAPNQAQPQAVEGTTAAAKYGWGTPNREDDFSGDLSGWGLYDGPGHAGNGRRSPSAATVANGVLTIHGDAQGTTEGMAWNNGQGQKYGRWEGRVKAPASDPTYNALLLLWPDAENYPVGGEIDFMEMTDNTRQSTNLFLHYGADDSQVHGEVKIDATQWHNWAVEWTPKGVTTYVDGNPWWHTDDTSILPPGPMHLCIQLDWFPGDGHGSVRPSDMQVDWVRQYTV